MSEATVDESAIRHRILAAVEEVLGYRPDPNAEQLGGLDSLQVLELLVTLEEEFNIDSDLIIEARPDWWSSLDELVTSISALLRRSAAEAAEQS